MRYRNLVAGCAFAALVFAAGCGGHTAPTPSANDVREFDSAVTDGDTDIVDRLIKAKPEMINAKAENGDRPLKIAKQHGNQDMIDLLTKHGAHE